jgi:hypothetical protein
VIIFGTGRMFTTCTGFSDLELMPGIGGDNHDLRAANCLGLAVNDHCDLSIENNNCLFI